jgi:AraC-like DNA-binding protein
MPARENLAPSSAWMMISGQCRIVQDDQQFVARPGQWVVPKPGPRKQFFTDGAEILSVAFMARWPHGEDLLDLPGCLILENAPGGKLDDQARELARAVENALGHHCDWQEARRWPESLSFSDYAAIEGCFLRWLSNFAEFAVEGGARLRGFSARDERVREWIERMETWPLSEKFSPDVLAGEISISRRTLDELFREETGKSAQAYFNEVMLARLTVLLDDPGLQIKQIAYEAGFEYPSSFTRWFRGMTGMTPREYRAEHQE